MKILVDMDNTLNKLWIRFFEYYNSIYNQNVFVKREDLISYQLAENIDISNIKDDIYQIKEKIFSYSDFWKTIPVFDEYTIPVFRQLCDNHDVYVCTTPWNNHIECCSNKLEWLKKNFPFYDIDKTIFIYDKTMIKADVIIDDYPKNLTHNIIKIIPDFPYNKEVKDGKRIQSWLDIKNILIEDMK